MRYNLKSNGGATTPTGTNNVVGTALYEGSGSVANWAGWRLAAGSPGENAGNDAQDMGTLYFGGTAAPETTPPNPPTGLKFQ